VDPLHLKKGTLEENDGSKFLRVLHLSKKKRRTQGEEGEGEKKKGIRKH